MADTKYAGLGGQLNYPSDTRVEGIKSWTLDVTCDVVEATDFADTTGKTYMGSQWSWSGTFEGYKAGVPKVLIGTTTSIKLSETQSGTQFWSGSCILTGLSVGVPVDGMITYAYTFQGTGELTEPTT